MRELWQRLEAAAGDGLPPLRLRPGTTEAAIAAAERTMGMAFPEDFRASLLVHDGQEPGEHDLDTKDWLPGHAPLASLDAIVTRWQEECRIYEQFGAGDAPEEIEGGALYHYLAHPKRIPIAGNPWWDQDNTYIDLYPGPTGKPGQLAMFGKGVFGVVHGPSFRGALELFVAGLESGVWRYDGAEALAKAKNTSWLKYLKKKLGAPPAKQRATRR
jgi:cell wall assembly regulator SMI1